MMRTILKGINLTLAILPVFTVISCGQTPTSVPKEFVETTIPKVWSEDWYKLDRSGNSFGVSIIDGKLDVKKVSEVNRSEFKLPSGTLIGVNRGEWGGHLSFKPADNAKKVVKIKGGNIKFIFEFKRKIHFIEGLAHMGYNKGALFGLDTTGGKFTYAQLVNFEDAPEAYTIYKGSLLIATYKNFYIIKEFKKELVLKDAFWQSLAPNSIAAFDDQNVFIGITSGIAKLDLTNKTLKFYRYKE